MRAPRVDRQLDAGQRGAGADAAEDLAEDDLVGLARGRRRGCAPSTGARSRSSGSAKRDEAGRRARRAPGRRSARRRGSRGRRGGGRGRRGRAGRGGRRREWRRRGRACLPPGRPPRRGLFPGRSSRCSISSPRAISTSWTSSGGNSPWSITPGRRRQPRRERGRVVDRAEVVGDRAAVGAQRHVAQLGLAERAQRRREPERRAARAGPAARSASTTLSRRGDHDEAVGRRRDDLLARVRAAAALDEPAVGVDLVGAVDRDVEPVELLERLDREPERARGDLGGDRRRDAAQSSARAPPAPAASEATVEPVPRPTRSPSLRRARRRLGRRALLGVAVSHRR